MAVEIKVPALGESIVEATVGKWLKREGDSVNAGEPVVELETDKVNIEVMAEGSGVIESIVKNEGENVSIGDTIGTISVNGSAAASASQGQNQPTPAPQAEPAEAAEPTTAPTQPETEDRETAPSQQQADDRATPASPVAKKMAADQGVDLRDVTGSGPGGRITKDDVAARGQGGQTSQPPVAKPQQQPAATQPAAQPQPAPAKAAPKPAAAPAASDRPEERVRMSRRRQTIAQRLVEAQQTAAMLTTFNEVDMTAVMEIRKRRKDAFKERHGVGLGFMSFFTKAVIGALKAFPYLNAEIQGDEIVVKRYYDIGIAVGAEEGLVVPVVRNADRKSFAQLEREIVDLATRAREAKLTLSDLQGGTFTITNGGVFGSLMSTPILNTPQVGILGMHKIQERPVAVNGQIEIRPMMYLALSYDHRIVDGSEAVRFLVRIKELLEDPENLLLEG
ncbi:MAG: 2-oxoglutarate dehydrogenase complex dihydrolipoyllysine-residue succinyltransferase [Chloroflexi bacterium]|nr:2-oxoglutarate dehydrogenase complex dihydrolipoyllysine-residue succinyltransferase [Chloroflexota bacterium]